MVNVKHCWILIGDDEFLMTNRPVVHDIKTVCVVAQPSRKNLYSCLIVYETDVQKSHCAHPINVHDYSITKHAIRQLYSIIIHSFYQVFYPKI
jgi:hypothetical protein